MTLSALTIAFSHNEDS